MTNPHSFQANRIRHELRHIMMYLHLTVEEFNNAWELAGKLHPRLYQGKYPLHFALAVLYCSQEKNGGRTFPTHMLWATYNKSFVITEKTIWENVLLIKNGPITHSDRNDFKKIEEIKKNLIE